MRTPDPPFNSPVFSKHGNMVSAWHKWYVSVSADIKSIAIDFDRINQEIESIYQTISTLSDQISTAQNNIESINNSIEQIQSSITSLQQSIQSINDALNDFDPLKIDFDRMLNISYPNSTRTFTYGGYGITGISVDYNETGIFQRIISFESGRVSTVRTNDMQGNGSLLKTIHYDVNGNIESVERELTTWQ